MRLLVAFCSLYLLLLVPHGAWANGRFPRALRLSEGADGQLLTVYGTYGLVVSDDGGQTWQHVCEAATGAYAGEAPALELLSNAQLVLSTDRDLMRSTHSLCDWASVLSPATNERVEDITRAAPGSSELIALVSSFTPEAGFGVSLYRSAPGAETFSSLAVVPPELIERALTVDVAPSDPQRWYVSGINAAGVGVVVRSPDGGSTFEAFEVPLTSPAAAPYLAAVHPTNPDLLFARTDELELIDNEITARDRLLFSQDGGETWTSAFERHAKLLGFALSPHGDTLLLGYGDPVLFAYDVDPLDVGIYRLRTADLTSGPDAGAAFTKLDDASTTCLRWGGDIVYGCFTQQETGFEVGRVAATMAESDDALIFEALLDLSAVRPMACSGDASAAICPSDPVLGWPAACTKLGAPCDLDDAGSAAEPDAGAQTRAQSNCGCRMGPAQPSPTSVLLLLGLFFHLRRRYVARRGARARA